MYLCHTVCHDNIMYSQVLQNLLNMLKVTYEQELKFQVLSNSSVLVDLCWYQWQMGEKCTRVFDVFDAIYIFIYLFSS